MIIFSCSFMNQCTISHSLQTETDASVNKDNGIVEGLKESEPAQEAEQNPENLTGNTKLWLGKDYSNFIRKDWNQLDRPFEGTLSKPQSVTPPALTHKHTS